MFMVTIHLAPGRTDSRFKYSIKSKSLYLIESLHRLLRPDKVTLLQLVKQLYWANVILLLIY